MLLCASISKPRFVLFVFGTHGCVYISGVYSVLRLKLCRNPSQKADYVCGSCGTPLSLSHNSHIHFSYKYFLFEFTIVACLFINSAIISLCPLDLDSDGFHQFPPHKNDSSSCLLFFRFDKITLLAIDTCYATACLSFCPFCYLKLCRSYISAAGLAVNNSRHKSAS